MISSGKDKRISSDPFCLTLGSPNLGKAGSTKPKEGIRLAKAGHLIKVLPTRATRKVCQERLACKGPRRVAVFECVQCSSLQCDACETLIHENSRFIFHDRCRLAIPKKEHLCEHLCDTKNLADIYCQQCKKQFCYACEAVLHQGRAKTHTRTPFEADEFYSLSKEAASGDTQAGVAEEEKYESFDSETTTSLSSPSSYDMMSMKSVPDVASIPQRFSSLITPKSFLLIDDKESLHISNEDNFIQALNSQQDTAVKVISIFGNTGEGKSYTLNHTFFKGEEVFATSPTQVSCTIGAWASFDSNLNVILIDTEGLLGLTDNQHQRTRLLLKILAISDIIIYRTRAPRLTNDLFDFLGSASKAYRHHFSKELKAASKRCNFEGPLSSLGPAAIIFHETEHTELLKVDPNSKKSPEDILKNRFKELDISIDAFSALKYVGTKTVKPPTSFVGLVEAVKKLLEDSSIRSARTPDVVYKALKVLNEKFSGDIEKTVHSTFPDQYFRCNVNCMSCIGRCSLSMNHSRDGTSHICPDLCRYQHQYNNQKYLCQVCFKRGEVITVIPKTSSTNESGWFGIAKYAWAGYVLECTNCGVIYRSRQYWYGNKDPWESVVRTEICHIWPDGSGAAQSNQNAAQRVIDSVSYISEAVTTISVKPTKSISSWVADQIAPSYWVPNYAITHCADCKHEFEAVEKKHHCRSCGEGFCDDCSTKTKAVPERGWGLTLVRVCNACYEKDEESAQFKEETVTARQVGEVVGTVIGTVASAIDFRPLIKDHARPSYWIPDEHIKDCAVCKAKFTPKLLLHHCRGCGQGVCNSCSLNRKTIPNRGWDYPVRICNTCDSKPELL